MATSFHNGSVWQFQGACSADGERTTKIRRLFREARDFVVKLPRAHGGCLGEERR